MKLQMKHTSHCNNKSNVSQIQHLGFQSLKWAHLLLSICRSRVSTQAKNNLGTGSNQLWRHHQLKLELGVPLVSIGGRAPSVEMGVRALPVKIRPGVSPVEISAAQVVIGVPSRQPADSCRPLRVKSRRLRWERGFNHGDRGVGVPFVRAWGFQLRVCFDSKTGATGWNRLMAVAWVQPPHQIHPGAE
jgi:hypothetical protein